MLYIELSSVITYWSFGVPQCPLNGHDHGQRNQVHDNIKVSYNCQVGTWTGTMIAGACHSPIHGQLGRGGVGAVVGNHEQKIHFE